MPNSKKMPKLHPADTPLFNAEQFDDKQIELSQEFLNSAANLTKISYSTALELTKLIHSEGGAPKNRKEVLTTFKVALDTLDGIKE